jgi:hypothetical protein
MGVDWLSSTLHWGPVAQLDSYLRTWGIHQSKAKPYNTQFHKYTLEWTDKYIMTCKCLVPPIDPTDDQTSIIKSPPSWTYPSTNHSGTAASTLHTTRMARNQQRCQIPGTPVSRSRRHSTNVSVPQSVPQASHLITDSQPSI